MTKREDIVHKRKLEHIHIRNVAAFSLPFQACNLQVTVFETADFDR
jgi:hypothetical protein